MANNNKVTQSFKDIAQAIRNKTGDEGKMTAADMPEKIEAIPVGINPEGTKEISANGEFNVREFESVNVSVPGATTKDKLDVTENGEYNIAEYARVDVNVPNEIPEGYVKPEGTKYIGSDDVSRESSTTIDVADYKDVSIHSVKDLCSDSYHASSDDLYDSYGHYNPEIYIAGYSSINVQDLGGGPSIETLYGGYYHLPYSTSVLSASDFQEIDAPCKINGNEGLLVINENSYCGYFPGSGEFPASG
jgi:hypothetical protein